MNRKWVTGIVLALSFAVTAPAAAHEGHTHKILGTVVSLQGDHLDVKTTDGKTVTVTLNGKTAIVRGTTKLDRTALKPGERVSVDANEQKKVMVASSIKLATTAAAAKK